MLDLLYTHAHGTVELGAVEVGVEGGSGPCADLMSSALDDRICSPPFMELTSLCGDDTMRLLEQNGLAFPFSMYTVGPRVNIATAGGGSPYRPL